MLESLSVLIRSNLGKSISIELLLTTVDCLLRILYFLKDSQKVLNVDWIKIWSGLMLLVKFIASNHVALLNKSFDIIITVSKMNLILDIKSF